ncbi:MAG TPA: mucoidy inhibitor MuiA family protein [Thermoflexales bacterium]|nr:mucoidy inhibitor MuiA family protein [Thermoflexales bacterium]
MTDITTTITAVTVYEDRAQVTRVGKARLAAGANVLVLGGLPTSLDAGSVRVKGRGNGARIAGSEVASAYLTTPVSGNAAALQAALEGLRDQDTAILDDLAAVADQLEMLKALRDHSGPRFAKAIASGKATIDTMRPVAGFLAGGFSEALARKRDLNAKRRDLAREIKAAEERLRQAGSTARVETREIRIDVDATSDAEAELEVTYVVDGAWWVPIYDARLSGTKLSVTYFAQVRQTTGENWPACALSLSTAQTGTGGDIPELDPWYIAKYAPPVPMPKRMMTRQAMAAPDDLAVSSAPMPAMSVNESSFDYARMPEPQAVVENNGIAVTYRAQRPVAIASDGTQRKVLIGEAVLDAALDYVSVPKLSEDAYLRAKVKNTSELVFLPGSANVFHDEEMVGTSTFEEPVMKNSDIELQMGVDDRIRISRELTQRDTGKTLIGNTRRLTFGYRIKVSNTRDSAVKLSAQDQMPVSRHEDIKVRLAEALPRPIEVTDLNLLKWELDVPAGASREITFTYTVEHPRDMQVTGLE